MEKIKEIIRRSMSVKEGLLGDEGTLATIGDVVAEIVKSFKDGGKVLLCGNGGSAADAQHIAAEFSGKFYFDRKPLYAEALHTNTSYLTAVANDYSFEDVFTRLIEAKGKKGDVLVGISTSGRSKNIVSCLAKAKQMGLATVGFTGQDGGEMKNECRYLISVPSDDVPRIQEAHIMVGHIICELVEAEMFT